MVTTHAFGSNRSGFSVLEAMVGLGLLAVASSVFVQFWDGNNRRIARLNARVALSEAFSTAQAALSGRNGSEALKIRDPAAPAAVGLEGEPGPQSNLWIKPRLASTLQCRLVGGLGDPVASEKMSIDAMFAGTGAPVLERTKPLAGNPNVKVSDLFLVQVVDSATNCVRGSASRCINSDCNFNLYANFDATRDDLAWVGEQKKMMSLLCRTKWVTQGATGYEELDTCRSVLASVPDPSPSPSESPTPLEGDVDGNGRVDSFDLEFQSLFHGQMPNLSWSLTLRGFAFSLDSLDGSSDRNVGASGAALITQNLGKTTNYKACFSETGLARSYAYAAALAPPTGQVTFEDVEIIDYCLGKGDGQKMNDGDSGCKYCSFASIPGGKNVGELSCGEIDVDGFQKTVSLPDGSVSTQTLSFRDLRLAQLFLSIHPAEGNYRQSGCSSVSSVSLPLNDWESLEPESGPE
ncbi:MAG: hypothetical protein ACK5QT_05750 [Oligoflexia bacterium]